MIELLGREEEVRDEVGRDDEGGVGDVEDQGGRGREIDPAW